MKNRFLHFGPLSGPSVEKTGFRIKCGMTGIEIATACCAGLAMTAGNFEYPTRNS
jgi:hypothetical protein